jgi:hypothetical protein
VEEEDVDESAEDAQGSMERSRTQNFGQQEDIDLRNAWMNVSLDASVGTD